MKKFLIPALLTLSVCTFAQAEGPQQVRRDGHSIAPNNKILERRLPTASTTRESGRPKMDPSASSSADWMNKEGERAGSPWGMTGDKATDDQLIALQKEMRAKLEALKKEYDTRAKTIIGDKKVMLPKMMGNASGTPPMRPHMNDDEHGDGESMHNPNASGTPVGERPSRPEGDRSDGMRRDNRGAKPTGSTSSGPVGMFNGFFQSFFGGNRAVAETH